MLDIHTHILPEMDDGSRSVKQSISMLRRERKQGITRVALTSHFYADKETPEDFLARRTAAIRALETAMSGKGSLPLIIPAAEVAYFTGISRTEGIEQLCIGDAPAMLIEMPFCRWTRNVLDEIEFLMEYRGIRPILAHIERYMRFQPRGTIRQLCDSGVWIQANASFFLRWQTVGKAVRMLRRNEIHFIGSDCHDVKHRPPNMEAAISVIDRRLGKLALNHLKMMEERLLEEEMR